MNVGMILAGKDFPPDIRVEKEARALRDSGHKVFILCDQVKSNASVQEWEGLTILRRKRLDLPTLFEKFNNIPGWIAFLDGQWSRFIAEVVRSEKIDVLHIHDLPKAGAAVTVGKKIGIPVIMDLHENYPASLRTYVEGWKGGMHFFARNVINPEKWEEYEKIRASQADRVIVVVEEAKERLVQNGISAEKITVIENTEDVDYFKKIPLDLSIIKKYQKDFVVLYIGGFGGRGDHRGLTTAVQAMPLVVKEIPEAKLLLVGKGSIKSTLKEMVAQYSLENQVTFIDWVPFEQVPSYIAASSVCLVPHHSNPHTEATSPHKLFQYMLMRKPVIVSSCRPLKRVVEEIGSGVVFRAGDSEDLCRAILRLRDESIRTTMSEKGYRAVIDSYNWGATSKKLIGIYNSLQKNNGLRCVIGDSSSVQ